MAKLSGILCPKKQKKLPNIPKEGRLKAQTSLCNLFFRSQLTIWFETKE